MRIHKSSLLPVALTLALSLAACGEQPAPPAPADAGPQAETTAPAGPEAAATNEEAAGGKLTPARIAEIRASGRTGVWSDVAGLCEGEHAKATIGWNVEASGAEAVTVNLVGASGNEKLFAQGSPVGEKATGNWLRPGMAFKVRAKDDARELAALEIAERQDCDTK